MSLKQEMKELKKCKELVNSDLTKPQPYISYKCLEEVRMAFRIQCRMVDCPGNMKGMYVGRMECVDCTPWWGSGDDEPPVATQEHLTICPAFSVFREGMNLDLKHISTDLIRYFMNVTSARKKNQN